MIPAGTDCSRMSIDLRPDGGRGTGFVTTLCPDSTIVRVDQIGALAQFTHQLRSSRVCLSTAVTGQRSDPRVASHKCASPEALMAGRSQKVQILGIILGVTVSRHCVRVTFELLGNFMLNKFNDSPSPWRDLRLGVWV